MLSRSRTPEKPGRAAREEADQRATTLAIMAVMLALFLAVALNFGRF
jgi:hypothetical protein